MVQTGRKLNVCVHLLFAHFICFYKCVCIHVCAYLYMEIYVETSNIMGKTGRPVYYLTPVLDVQ